ncbi:BRCA2-interacting transcriptional repressor EMSY-like [Lytechinus variegatus]|uniref:BRCA2-interacting transcriptional repressor EMSY-like n=1 Tax=Lytechinus variegatus TaxID=7654 RepID=UPI001BB1F47C|nr:BRCA2-interacting transcriptional repressor EMSY-like [Lytechinus variegatus]
MWPRLLDMEEKECRSVLRRLELEAYSSVISAFRAQGDLTPEKKSLLRTIATTLSVSTERHKAEVRRAVNDEKLTTIAERVSGENNSMEWSSEGRRLVPLTPRFIPQTAYTMTANQVANMAHAHNASLPDPEQTAKKEGDESRASSDGSSESKYVVLPPGTVLPKSSPDLEQLDELAKRRPPSSSSSYSSSPASFLSALTSAKLSSSSEGRSKGRASSGSSAAPSTMKITFTKVGSGTTPTSSQAAQKQVIIMSSGNTDQIPPAEMMSVRSPSFPPSSKVAMSEGHPPFQMTYEDQLTGVVTPYPPVTKHHRKGSKHKSSKPFTIIQQSPSAGVGTFTSSGYGTQVTGSGSGAPMAVGSKRAGTAPQRPEPGMKLITQTVGSGTSSGRMSSKTVTATLSTPSVRTTTIGAQAPRSTISSGPQSTSLGARNIVTSPGPRIVTVPGQMGGRHPSSSSNVITLSPMSLQKTAGKNTATTVVVTKPGSVMPGKTNVIVVQKSQIKSKMISTPRTGAPGVVSHTTSVLTRPKIAMTMTGGLASSVSSPNTPTSPGTMAMHSIRFPSPPSSAQQKTVRGPSPVSMSTIMGGVSGRGPSAGQGGMGALGKSQGMVRSKSPIAQSMSMLSADLELHSKAKGHRRSSAGSLGHGSSKVVVEEVPSSVMRSASLGRDPSLIFQSSVGKPNTEWIDYDGSPPASQSASSAIKALLEIRGQPLPPTTAVKQVPFSGVSPGLPTSSMSKPSSVTRRIPSSSPSSSYISGSDNTKDLSQSHNVITVDPKTASTAERLEFSSDQLSSVVDQFEQFLESEEALGSGKQSSGGDPALKSPEQGDPKKVEDSSKIDPFEFVEEIISKESESSVPSRSKVNYGQEIPKAAVMDRAQVIGHKITPQVTPTVAESDQPSVTSVVMESASSFDITQMNLEDLSCQRMREDEDDDEEDDDKRDDLGSSSELMSFLDTSSGGSGSEGAIGPDGLRVSRRKRKAPTPIDEETGPSSMPSWARAAWNLLQRVMRFRGANRPKGGINAASWFTRPVDPSEAPGYHKVIKKPMDFGTIKRNLEAATYQDFAEFHHDMMLVRGNCLQYNPPGHAARRDCEEVFQFYSSEYSKTLDRWQKQLLSMPKSPKRIRADPPAALQPPTPTQQQ